MIEGYVSRNIIDKYPAIYFLHQVGIWKKNVITRLFKDKKVVVITEKLPKTINTDACVIAWGTRIYSDNYNSILKELTVLLGLKCIRIEAAFFQSVRLAGDRPEPFSILSDDLGCHYDATKPSRMEILLENEELDGDILKRSRSCIDYIVRYGVSKMNCLPHIDTGVLYGDKKAKRILVVGQVENDEAIVRGILGNVVRCSDLVRIAMQENPGAEIIYKVHPEVLGHYRKGDGAGDIVDGCKILSSPCSIHSALKTIDRIYTISSTVGFEGLLRNIPVVCFGTPFYSGWGLTEDRDKHCNRRSRLRSIEELFAIAGIIYPDYFDSKTIKRIPIEDVLEKLRNQTTNKPAFLRISPKGTLVTTENLGKRLLKLPFRGVRYLFRKMLLLIGVTCKQMKRATYAFWKIWYPSNIAFLAYHTSFKRFIGNVNKHTAIRIHSIESGKEHAPYRKVIVPNGLWPWIRDNAELIPEEKKVFMEAAFFPQHTNVYFDLKGVHGYSSVRHAHLQPLTQDQKRELEDFRKWYMPHNFVRYARMRASDFDPESGKGKYNFPFILAILQSEDDSAFQLCPFSKNQDIINFIESCFLARTIIFKAHPYDHQPYKVRTGNLLLPAGNTDLRELLLRAEYVVSVNSTVLLQALMYKKICASLGEGFSTDHNVCLECHRDRHKLRELPGWQPDWDKVDQFLYFLLEKQISMNFWEHPKELSKLLKHFEQCSIL